LVNVDVDQLIKNKKCYAHNMASYLLARFFKLLTVLSLDNFFMCTTEYDFIINIIFTQNIQCRKIIMQNIATGTIIITTSTVEMQKPTGMSNKKLSPFVSLCLDRMLMSLANWMGRITYSQRTTYHQYINLLFHMNLHFHSNFEAVC
jgi:hypothetical protein